MTTVRAGPRRLCVLGLASAAALLCASGQLTAQGIRGTYDPVTKSFMPLAPRVGKTAAPKLTTVTGTFKISVSVKINPKIPTNVQLAAALTIVAADPDTFNPALSYTINTGGNLARTGDAGTLSLKIPYIYKLADPSAPVTFTLQIYEPSGGTKFQPSSTGTTTIKLPKDGTTTPVVLGETI